MFCLMLFLIVLIILFIIKKMLFQPLEQFKPTIIGFINEVFETCSLILQFIVLNKYLIIVFVILSLFFTILQFLRVYKKIHTYLKFQILYNRIVFEMINIVSFNFIFSAVLYFSVFIYVYIFNSIGLFPNTPCWTTQIYANLMLSFTLIMGITLLNIDKNGVLFFQLFIPKDVPQFLIPFLFTLEFLSYFIRILSSSIRLFSNMVAGHSLSHILYDMVLNIKYVLEAKLDLYFFIFFVLIGILLIIVFSEFIAAFLQAYVFSVMFTIYLNDLNLQH
jgi:ATP synthase subunit 6